VCLSWCCAVGISLHGVVCCCVVRYGRVEERTERYHRKTSGYIELFGIRQALFLKHTSGSLAKTSFLKVIWDCEHYCFLFENCANDANLVFASKVYPWHFAFVFGEPFGLYVQPLGSIGLYHNTTTP